MTAESLQERMARGDKMLKLFEQGVEYQALCERFGLQLHNVFNILKEARKRREKSGAK